LKRLAAIVALIGPRPIALVRTIAFLIGRELRQRRLRASFASRYADDGIAVSFTAPRIELGRAALLPAPLVAAADAIRNEAEAILRHTVDYLGSGPVELGREIDWHRDFKSGHRWEPTYYLDMTMTRIQDASDAKVPWELSRGHQLLTLARAAALFKDERYARELEAQLGHWLDANPPGTGVNWANAMEVGLRAVNWLWAVGTLESGLRPLDQTLRSRVASSLCAHAEYIRANIEGTPYLRSNHFVADMLGLLAVSAALEGEVRAPFWRRFARAQLEREVVRQVHDDGVSFESSVAYHGLVLEMLLLARLIASQAGQPLSPRFNARVTAMLEASRGLRHPSGRIPLFGDQDSGRVLPGGFDRSPTHDNLLGLGAAILGLPRFLPGAPDAEVAWTLGLEAWRALAAAPEVNDEPRSAFPDAGLYVLRGDDTHLVVRCGGVGQHGGGGHSHNDALSFELSVGDVPIVVDSGTYAYTSDLEARNELRATAAHNTLVLDGDEINPFDPTRVFELPAYATPTVESFRRSDCTDEWAGFHDGFRPVIHRRTIRVGRHRRSIEIDDALEGIGEHEIVGRLHFAPETRVDGVGDQLFCERASVRVSIVVDGADELDLAEGWVSNRYGVRTRAPVIVARARRELPTHIQWRMMAIERGRDDESRAKP
jgi:uncharacterized heparinase superfamily protein